MLSEQLGRPDSDFLIVFFSTDVVSVSPHNESCCEIPRDMYGLSR